MSFKEKKPCGKLVAGDVVIRREKKEDLYHADSPSVGQVVIHEVKEDIVGKGNHKGVKARFRFLGGTEDKVGDLYCRDLIGHLSDKQFKAEERKRLALEKKKAKEEAAKMKAEAGNIPVALYAFVKGEDEPFGCHTEAVLKAFKLLTDKSAAPKAKKKGRK